MIWAPSAWNDFTSSLSEEVMLSNAKSAYLRIGLRKDVQMISSDLRSRMNFREGMMCSFFQAFFLTSWIWSCQEQELEKRTPRCLCDLTSSMRTEFMKIGGCTSLSDFLDKRSDSVLEGLNETSQYSTHVWMVLRSLLS